MKPWRTIERRTVLDQAPWLKVEYHTVELPDGRTISNWSWVITPDYINVVAFAEEGKCLLFRQVKYGLGGETLALIGGYVAEGEDPLAAAQRELREETGYTAEEWIELGHYLVDPNRGMAVGHLYLARGARRAGFRNADDLEEQQLIEMTLQELEAALERGEFKVLAWAAAVAFAINKLRATSKD